MREGVATLDDGRQTFDHAAFLPGQREAIETLLDRGRLLLDAPTKGGKSLADRFSKTPARIGPVPTPGQHTDEILGAVLGYDAAKLAALRVAKAIA